MTDRDTAFPEVPISVRDALRLIWEADRYPILGNADRREAEYLDRIALTKAATAVPSPDDPLEFARWLNTLRREKLPNDEREEVMWALYDFFDPENGLVEE